MMNFKDIDEKYFPGCSIPDSPIDQEC